AANGKQAHARGQPEARVQVELHIVPLKAADRRRPLRVVLPESADAQTDALVVPAHAAADLVRQQTGSAMVRIGTRVAQIEIGVAEYAGQKRELLRVTQLRAAITEELAAVDRRDEVVSGVR